ncbi:MAG: HEAT repeat domain-containing protein [Planctomycetes bacterium]|nr:HEAT repeat domain-containing protein [Planctomycetota bacterium]
MARPHAQFAGILVAWTACLTSMAAAQSTSVPAKTQQETMAERGYVRYRGAWRTAQEIELLERAERAHLARAEWKSRLERLRRQLDEPAQAERAAEEIAEIADPAAVPALTAAVSADRALQARVLFLKSLARIRSGDATAALMAVAVDHADPETRIAAVEHLATVAPEAAVAGFTAALASPDNARINRAADALGRLLGALPAESPLRHDDAVLARLVATLETQHVGVMGDGTAEGATSVTFTPSGGGLALGGGPKPVRTAVKNERVLDTLAACAGVNFEWNIAAWRDWLATREAPADLDLRRR